MSHYVGYSIRGHVYTAPQMMALRRIVSGHSIGEGRRPTTHRQRAQTRRHRHRTSAGRIVDDFRKLVRK